MRDCVKASKGVAQLNLSTKWLADYEIPTPKIEEQKRIVARIEELFSELDNGVETLQKTKLQLAVYRQAVLRDAFAGLDTFVSLQSISERIFDGPFGSNLKTSDYTSSGIRVVRLENLKDGWFDDSKQSFVTQEKYDAISSHTVYPTDLIMSTFIADSIKVCQMPENIGFAVNKADCIGIRLKSNYVQRYVMYYLMTKNAYNSLAHEVHGATRPRVNTKQIKGIQIPMCDLSAQKQIVRNIESRLSVCDSIEKTVDAALQQAEAMRQSILKQAFEGRL
jgi:type I restriction enzyme S subunit